MSDQQSFPTPTGPVSIVLIRVSYSTQVSGSVASQMLKGLLVTLNTKSVV